MNIHKVHAWMIAIVFFLSLGYLFRGPLFECVGSMYKDMTVLKRTDFFNKPVRTQPAVKDIAATGMDADTVQYYTDLAERIASEDPRAWAHLAEVKEYIRTNKIEISDVTPEKVLQELKKRGITLSDAEKEKVRRSVDRLKAIAGDPPRSTAPSDRIADDRKEIFEEDPAGVVDRRTATRATLVENRDLLVCCGAVPVIILLGWVITVMRERRKKARRL